MARKTPASPTEERLFLIDGTALAYQQHFAMARNPLRDSKGRNTSAVFGFANRVLSLLEKERPDHIAVAFDGSEPTFRHEEFAEYKATRDKMPDELVDQLDWIREVVEGLRIPFIVGSGYEADDVIGTLARWAEDRGVRCFIVTSDKDFFQLVTDRVRVVDPRKDWEELGPEEVEGRFGVPPDQVCDVLALMGDASDNVPGVRGIGAKGAVKLVRQYGSLDEVLRHVTDVKAARTRKALEEHADQARLSRDLVRIRRDLALDLRWEDLALGEPDRTRLHRLFSDLEFETLTRRFTSGQETDVHSYRTVRRREQLDHLIGDLRAAGSFVLDLETTGLDPISAEIVGVAVASDERRAHYIPLNDATLAGECGGREGILDLLRPILEDARVEKGGQNIKYDLQVLENEGIRLQGLAFDTMVSSFLIDSGLRQHNLDFLALRYLNYRKIATRDVIGGGEGQLSMLDVPVEDVAPYACEDADITLRLHRLFSPRIREMGLESLYADVEIPLVGVLQRMERAGIGLDRDRLSDLSGKLEERIRDAQRRVHEIAGEEFNVGSTQQLGKVLFEKMEIQKKPGAPRARRTKTGYSTQASVLEQFQDEPIVAAILEHRSLSKLKNTYVDALPRFLHPRTGRIHTSFHQTGAATGRLSSSEPNLQNIPIRTETGQEIRAAFVPGREGARLLSADYSQIELRLLAHLARDPGLVAAFAAGEDVHVRTAAAVFGVDAGEVTPAMRDRAKVVNYGIIYGMGPRRLSRETGASLEEARAFIEAYFDTYTAIRDYVEDQKRRAREEGHVSTLLGRRRTFPDIHAPNRGVVEAAERAAVNTPIQGSAADVIKMAMIEIDREIRDRRMGARMLLQVHDELVFEVPAEEIGDLRDLVRDRMEGAADLAVPLRVEIGVGRNWLDAH